MAQTEERRYTIYQIENSCSGRIYVGSTYNLRLRITSHLCKMRKCHPNRLIMDDVRVYGIDSFNFSVLEDGVIEAERFIAEQKWIDTFSSNGTPMYNMQPYAGKTRGRPVSVETRRKLSEAHKGRKFSEKARAALTAANMGRTFSEETRKKMSEKQLSKPPSELRTHFKLTEDDVREIDALLKSGETLVSIAKRFGVYYTAISKIKHGTTWSSVTGRPKKGVS